MTPAMSEGSGWSFGSKKALLKTSRDKLVRAKEPEDDLKRREESIFLKRAKQEARERQRRKEQRFFLFVVSAVIALLVLAAHFTYKAVIGHLPELHLAGMGTGYKQANDLSSFQLAGISPGMTPAMVKKVHDDAEVQVTETDIVLSTFTVRDTEVTVWHLGQSEGQQAFRIRARQTFDVSQEADVLKVMGAKFGTPNTETCDVSRISGIRDCQFSWRAEAIDLRARTQARPDGVLELVLLAEDVRIRRALEKQ